MIQKFNPFPTSQELDKFLSSQRQKDIKFLESHMGIDPDNAEDIYQEASIALVRNCREGRLKKLTASLSTYLLQICKFQATHFLRTKTRMTGLEIDRIDVGKINAADKYNDQYIDEVLNIAVPQDSVQESLLDAIEPMVKGLKEPCKSLLWGRFWDNLSHKELADILGYKSANTSKTQTSRCLDKFKDIVESIISGK